MNEKSNQDSQGRADGRLQEAPEPPQTFPASRERAFVIVATRFRLGQVYVTPGAKAALESLDDGEVGAGNLLARHMACDWGDDMDEEDKAANDRAVLNGNDRILSAYTLTNGTRIWIITEVDRSATTLLLPDEY